MSREAARRVRECGRFTHREPDPPATGAMPFLAMLFGTRFTDRT
jgi:hypothetical protein